MSTFRAIFLGFMTWLLVAFLPGHTRGAITMNAREAGGGDACCAPAKPVEPSCCADESAQNPSAKPTSKDRASCAVCFWAAGLLTTPAFVLDTSHSERSFEHARQYHAQVRRVACRLNQYGRDPPTCPA